MSQASALMTTYAQLPIAFSHGKGVWLYDEQGRRYLDALSGIAVNTLGHAHTGLVAALTDQIQKNHPHFKFIPNSIARSCRWFFDPNLGYG